MKKYLFIGVFILSSLSSYGQADIVAAAKSRLQYFISLIPQNHERDYGFKKGERLREAKIGSPFRILIFNRDSTGIIADDSMGGIRVLDRWLLPVTYSGEYRALLTVTKQNDKYRTVGFGASGMAPDLQKTSEAFRAGEQRYILRITYLYADFLVRKIGNSFTDAEYIPMPSAYEAIPDLAPNKPFYSLAEVKTLSK